MIRLLLLALGIVLGAALTLWFERLPRDDRAAAPTTLATPADDEGIPDRIGDDDDDEVAPSRVRRVDGALHVLLTPAEVAAAGIVSAPTVHGSVPRERREAGRVADPSGLLAALRELAAARAAASAQREVLTTLAARLERLRGLVARGEIAVTRELADLELEYRRTRELDVGHSARVEAARTALGAAWGNELAGLAERSPARLAPLADGSRRLVEFTSSVTPPDLVYATPGDDRAKAVAVDVLGPAAAVLGAAQSASFLGLAPARGLRSGMRLDVFIPQSGAAAEGDVLPADAVVWHRGEAWYFAVAGVGDFVRRPLGDALPHPSGWLLAGGDEAGGEVVLRGAQALLAEANREGIPEEDDD